jgi:alanine racemase
MQGRGVCVIDLDALAHNLGEVRRAVGDRVRVCAVVKADAYGHGAVPVARALLAHGAHSLAVACIDEARELRRAGLAAPILVLSGIEPHDAIAALELGLTAVIWDRAAMRAIGSALPAGKRLRVHLKIDTGMNRIGAALEELGTIADELRTLPFDVEGVMSHFACGEVPDHPSFSQQRLRFEDALGFLAERGIRPALRHMANSGAVFSDPATHYDLVRPGIALYGGAASPAIAERVALRPVMQLRARVAHVHDVPAGAGIGYGQTFHTRRESRIAVLALGYGQGYPRALSNRGSVVVRDRLAPVVGTVSMDHTTVDVTDIPEVRVDDEAILWGRAEEPRLDVMQVGEQAATLGHELLTRVARAVPRIYRERDVARRASGR